MIRIPTALLAIGCAEAEPLDGPELVPIGVRVEVDDVALDVAIVTVDAALLDRCGGRALLFPVDRDVDALGGDPIEVLPGGYCGLELVLPEGPDVVLGGEADGAPWDAVVDLGGVLVPEPFVADRPLTLVLDLGALPGGESALAPIVGTLQPGSSTSSTPFSPPKPSSRRWGDSGGTSGSPSTR